MKVSWLYFVAALLAVGAGTVTLVNGDEAIKAVAYLAAGSFLLAMGFSMRKRESGGGDAR